MKFNPSFILFRYLILSYLKCFCFVLLGFFVITSMLEYMEFVRKFSVGNVIVSYRTILGLAIFNSISTISSFFPFTAFVGTILFFSMMHAKMEITAVKVLGISIWNIVKSLIIGTCIVGVAYLTVFDAISVFSVNRIKSIENRLNKKNENKEITVTNRGIWFRDLSHDSSYIVYAKSFSANSNSLYESRFFKFDNDNNFLGSIYSEVAFISDGNWILKNAKRIDLDGNEKIFDKLSIPTFLSFNNINKITANPKSISIWSISKYVSMVDKVGLSSMKYKMHFLYQVFSIFQMIALTLLGSVFCIGYNVRNPRRYILKVVIALSISFPLYFFSNIILALGENGDIPISIAVSIIPISTFCICSWLLSKK